MASLLDYLGDPDERVPLLAAWDGHLGTEGRLAYAAVLDAKDPERAEWLRLECALHAPAAQGDAPRARFEALSRVLSRDWQKLLSRTMVLNCGEARAEPPRVRFRVVCHRRWESLQPTEDPAVRHCEGCAQRVYRCERARDAEAQARAGHCIAVPAHLTDGDARLDTRNVLGMPDPVGDWAEAIFRDG